MEKFRFALVSVVSLVLFISAGYWAVTTMQSGSGYVNMQKIKALQAENEDLKNQVVSLQSQVDTLQPATSNTTTPPPTPNPTPPVTKPPTTTAYKNQTLINELQKLIDDKVVIKLKSQGTRVGTVEKFLNLYNNTSNRIDNDYGASTQKAVIAFQKDVGLTADGVASASTFKKMIDWLKKQG